jgi:hypothetical protein
MALCDYYSGFDFERIGTASVQFTDSGGSWTMTFSSGQYMHINASAVSDYNPFVTAVISAITAAVRPVTYAVSFNQTTMQYSFDVTSGSSNLAMTFVGASGTIMRHILGYSGDVGTTAAAIVSDVRPYYAIRSLSQGVSAFSDEYEPDDGVEDEEADDGTPYSISRYAMPVYCDWEQHFEEKTAPATAVSGGVATPGAGVFTHSASAAQPFTWQDMVKHLRGSDAFALYNLTTGAMLVCKLRQESATFHPARAMSEYDVLWNIPFKTRLLGRV